MLNLKSKLNADIIYALEGKEFHGKDTCYTLSLNSLRFIEKEIAGKNCSTLETGMGVSTLLFGLYSKKHIAICPHVSEQQSIEKFAYLHFLPMIPVEFIINKSEQILPTLKTSKLDLVLIDGDHAFPVPIIDWFYTQNQVKVGGVVIVDDTQLRACGLMAEFLLSESEWELVFSDSDRTRAFRKLNNYEPNRWWAQQPWTMETFKGKLKIN